MVFSRVDAASDRAFLARQMMRASLQTLSWRIPSLIGRRRCPCGFVDDRRHKIAGKAGFHIANHSLYLYGVRDGMKKQGKCSKK